ncbi:cytochrome P450 [Parafrankia sp. FMc6]|uniref:cytochrome P450 n=1 Tax=Parafrankia soli TaxID=2599596 RepID=UPI0034D53EBB
MKTSAIPGPPSDRLVGMSRALRDDLLGTIRDGHNEYGDLVSYRVGPRALNRHIVAVHHPDNIAEVLNRPDLYGRQTASFSALEEMFGENLVTTQGDTWKSQRRTLQPLFTPHRVKEYSQLMQEEAEKLLSEGYIKAGETADIAPAMERFALRVLGRTLFRNHQGVEEAIEVFERLVPLIGSRVRGRASSLIRPPLNSPAPSARRFKALRKELYDTVDSILAREVPQDPEGDLVGLIRTAVDPATGEHVSLQEVRNQALIFLVSGHTTTSNAITFTLYLLGRHPEIQEEIARNGLTQKADTNRLDLVRASIQEAMRLYPSAYAISRTSSQDCTLAGHRISKGTGILVSAWITHRHPDFWVDPEKFNPARFTSPTERPRFAYFPFGGGPRSCIGEHFAMLEAMTVVRTVLRQFRITSLDPDMPLAQLVSLRPAGPVRANWSPR